MKWEGAVLDRASPRPHADVTTSWTVSGELSNKQCVLEESCLEHKWAGLSASAMLSHRLGRAQEECGLSSHAAAAG